jgi:hypothetical protein
MDVHTNGKLHNKRMIVSIVAIIFSTIALCFTVWKIPAENIIECFKYYCFLSGGICGAYKMAQTFTDQKQIGGKNGSDKVAN